MFKISTEYSLVTIFSYFIAAEPGDSPRESGTEQEEMISNEKREDLDCT